LKAGREEDESDGRKGICFKRIQLLRGKRKDRRKGGVVPLTGRSRSGIGATVHHRLLGPLYDRRGRSLPSRFNQLR
jgi:hypothetical protein